MTSTKFKAITGNKASLEKLPISDGNVYFVDDTKELFFDFDSKRVEIKDILILEKESERTSILFAPLNKFYFVLETKILWLYKDGDWYQVSNSASGGSGENSAGINPTDLSNIITGLTITKKDDTSFTILSGHCVDSANSKVLRLESPITKTLDEFQEGNNNGGLKAITGDLIPINPPAGNVISANSDYPSWAFDGKNFNSAIVNTDKEVNYVGYNFNKTIPAGDYTIILEIYNSATIGFYGISVIDTNGNDIIIVPASSETKLTSNSTELCKIDITIPCGFTAIKIYTPQYKSIIDGVKHTASFIGVTTFQITAPVQTKINVNLIQKEDGTTDICIGNDIPDGFEYYRQIGKVFLNDDSTAIVDVYPKQDISAFYISNEIAVKSDIPTDYITETILDEKGYLTSIPDNYATKEDIVTTQNITYSELVELRNSAELIPGVFYRITDYVTTTNGASADSSEPSRSAGHPFDIVVQAIGTSDLAEIATCAIHEGDTYFSGQNLSAWQVWYDINNDTTKYQWADTVNGKGVIYRMIDEKNNDFPYDFKNIQFYRNASLAKYAAVKDRLVASDGYYYTMCDTTSGITDFSLAANDNTNNSMMLHLVSNIRSLNNIVFLQYTGSRNIQNNRFGIKCCNSTFMDISNNDITQGYFQNNILGAHFHYNTIGCYFQKNTTTGDFAYNLVMGMFQNNNIGAYFSNNLIMTYFQNNTIADGFTSNFIGSNFVNNTTGNGFGHNNIGNVVRFCQFGSYF